MKITISYLPEEQQKAHNLLLFIQSLLAGCVDKVRESDRNPPYKHIYVTTRKPKTRCASKRNS